MTLTKQIAWDDTILPFQLDAADVRGRVARLDGVLDRILAQHNYPPQVEDLVAEAVLLTAMIGQTIKLRWKLSLQIHGTGPVRMIATDYYAPQAEGEVGRLRAWASYDEAALKPGAAFAQLGEGYFTVLLDQGDGGQPYQGITPLTGGALASCAETYFAQSEQLPTQFALAYGRSQLPGQPEHWRAGGVMLQHMPKASPYAVDPQEAVPSGMPKLLEATDLLSDGDSENWNRVSLHLETVEDLELVGPQVQPTELLVRLFHEEAPRVFDSQPVQFGCSCSAQKVRDSLSIYPPEEIATMTTEKGTLTADCQFCGAHYEFDPATLGIGADGPARAADKR
ncbi:Hsp33 family molecular chaperone HslO [Frigidibacter sp. ROC022]|uniref:Hsp33 family molecular chaperone HslO n=1 Tax=Frigidibacter sp. ROC022 TaxID=2971796 RepID=UPI00215B6A99|nr:Hsp33 family molecular chaperone HslO [Frigidibacter sp. ROC022]MCR8724452.1 Hsp33 family molecular chaperone HslO [Frigidibacter sp. ROC022]